MASTASESLPRRSTRIQKSSSGSSLRTENISQVQPPQKRRRKKSDNVDSEGTKKSVTPAVRKKGSKKRTLSELPNMPLDILFEIFGHLHPLDLLHLTWTTKGFRSLLIQRSAKTIWMQARANLGTLPECPSDLSEMEYARLLFDPHCFFCDARVLSAFWNCRVKCCKKCFKDMFVDMTTVFFSTPKSDYIHPAALIPAVIVGRSESKDNLDSHVFFVDATPHQELMILKSDVEELSRAIEACAGDIEKEKKLDEERIALTQEKEDFGELLEDWHNHQNTKRSVELDTIRLHRHVAIATKLVEHGLAAGIPQMNREELDRLLDQPWMKQPKILTERIWSNIKDVVINYFRTFQATRIAKARCVHETTLLPRLATFLQDFTHSHPASEYIPSLPDFAFIPQFRAFLMNPNTDDGETRLKAVWDDMPRMSEEWRRTTSEKLLPLLPGPPLDGKTGPHDLSRLSLATTMFRCRCPSISVGYPRVLVHHCMTESRLNIHPANADDELLNALHLAVGEAPWSLERNPLTFDTLGSAIVRGLVTLCGKDPVVTTAEEMDELDARFVCPRPDSSQYWAMTWRRAVLLMRNYSEGGAYIDYTPPQWALLNESDTAIVKNMEDSEMDLSAAPIWICRHCYNFGMTERHIVAYHQITEHGGFQSPGSAEGNHFCISLDADSNKSTLLPAMSLILNELEEKLTSPVFTMPS